MTDLWPWAQPGYTIEVERRVVGATDSHGSPVVTFDDPVLLPFAVFAPAPAASAEPFRTGRPDLLVDLPVVYAPAGSAVSHLDRIRINGDTFEVAAEPGRWDDPATGETFGLAVPLRRVEG